MERRRVGFQIHIRAAIAQLHFSFGADSQHFVGQAPLVLARESKKRSGNVRYSALLCSACGFRSARKSVYNLAQQQSQEPELYKRGRTEKSSGDSVDHFPPAYITARRVSAVPAQNDAGSPIEISQPTTPPGPRSEPSKPRLLPSSLASAIPSPPTARRPPFAPNDSS